MSDVPNDNSVRFCFVCPPHVTFKCQTCNQWHYHGYAEGKPEGWRAAHCNTFNQLDYYLKMYTKKDLKFIKKMVDEFLSEKNEKN